MKIYRVDLRSLSDGHTEQLVRAASAAKARDHVLQVVSVKVATQDDMMWAVSGRVKIEEAGGGEGEGNA